MAKQKNCWNPIKQRFEECYQRNAGSGAKGPLPKCCLDGCGFNCDMLNELTTLSTRELSGVGSFYPLTQMGTFLTSTGLFDVFISMAGAELTYNGNGTGYYFNNFVDCGELFTTSQTLHCEAELVTATDCIDIRFIFDGELVFTGINWTFTFTFDWAVMGDPARKCYGNVRKCDTTAPEVLPTSINLVGALGAMTTENTGEVVSLENADDCCEIIHISTNVRKIYASLNDDGELLLTNLNSHDYYGNISVFIYTTCGVVQLPIDVQGVGCGGATLEQVFPEYVLVVTDLNNQSFIRATDIYDFNDPAGCCIGNIVGFVDDDISVVPNTNWLFVVDQSEILVPSIHVTTLSVGTTGCALGFTAPFIVISQDTACAGDKVAEETSLNVYNSGNPFIIPAGDTLEVVMGTPLFTFTDGCCGGLGVFSVLNGSGGVGTTGLTFNQLISSGTGSVYLQATGPVGVYSEVFSVITPCGTMTFDIDYEIV